MTDIIWGSSQFPITVDTTTVPAAVAAGMNGPIPPENNPAISVADGVFRFTMTGSATGQSLGTGFWISITDLPESLPIDARRYRFAADVKVNSMVGVVSMSFNVYPARQGAQAVVGLPMPTPATAPNFTDFTPVYQDFPPDRLPTLLAGADPSIYIIMTVGGLMSAGTGGPIDVEIRNIRLEAQEAVGGGTPSELHFRDPADGLFKPLTGIEVRGFPCEAPNYADAGMGWSGNLFTTDFNSPTVQLRGLPPEANLRATPENGGVRVQWDAFPGVFRWTDGWTVTIVSGPAPAKPMLLLPVTADPHLVALVAAGDSTARTSRYSGKALGDTSVLMAVEPVVNALVKVDDSTPDLVSTPFTMLRYGRATPIVSPAAFGGFPDTVLAPTAKAYIPLPGVAPNDYVTPIIAQTTISGPPMNPNGMNPLPGEQTTTVQFAAGSFWFGDFMWQLGVGVAP